MYAISQLLRGSPLSGTERTVDSARVVLAASLLLLQWLDPRTPNPEVALAYAELLYGGYAVVLAAVMWRRHGGRRFALVTHVIDIIAVSAFLRLFSLSGLNPGFLCLFFVLFAGTVRWGWRGTLATAGVVVAVILPESLGPSNAIAPYALYRAHLRVVHLAVLSGMLVYLERYQMRLREGIERLASWPRGVAENVDSTVQKALEYAALIVKVRRAVALWEVRDEPWICVARWDGARVAIDRWSASELDPMVADSLTDVAFVCPRTIETGVQLLGRRHAFAQLPGMPVHDRLLPLLRDGPVASAAFRSGQVSGRLFFVGVEVATREVLPLTEMVAREVGRSLEELYLSEQMRRISICDERLRVAHDLHDGVLQSLTGIRLELHNVASELSASEPQATREGLLAIERTLAAEQRELRGFIEGLKPSGPLMSAGAGLGDRLKAMHERIATEWRVPVSMNVTVTDAESSADLRQAVPLMVHEAVVNALTHANPSRVAVDVYEESGQLRIAVFNDGRGFPFLGRYDEAALADANMGPVSLRERVASLGGTLIVDSMATGSCVEVVLPMFTGRA